MKWNITVGTKIYAANVYVSDWKNKISELDGGITDAGRKIFSERISFVWIKNQPTHYYELTIKNLSYGDAHNFQMEVKYSNNERMLITNNSSSIKLIVDGKKIYRYNILNQM